ncbi:HEAT repeat domain-containing protein [Streptomyces sp. NPDC057950]|uniref:HEAT repeat domain-containing protein n=1 Tax=Streptomyces sp. NPDC057950 TaxID=3346288 RepID=UPI0036DFE0DA
MRSQVPDLIRQGPTPTEVATQTLFALPRDPDPEVRNSVVGTMGGRSLTTEFRDALLTLIRNTDFQVGARAAISLGNSDDGTAAVTDALVVLLDDQDQDQLLRLEIIYALAHRDDSRTEDAWEHVGELPPDFGEMPQQEDHRILAYGKYLSRNRPTEPHSPST